MLPLWCYLTLFIIDKFHVVKMANEASESARKELGESLTASQRGAYADWKAGIPNGIKGYFGNLVRAILI